MSEDVDDMEFPVRQLAAGVGDAVKKMTVRQIKRLVKKGATVVLSDRNEPIKVDDDEVWKEMAARLKEAKAKKFGTKKDDEGVITVLQPVSGG
jgi:hypothetical protein